MITTHAGGDNESVHSYQSAATSNSGYSYGGSGSGDGGEQSTGAPQGEISRVIADAISGLPQSIDSVKGSLQGSLQASDVAPHTLTSHPAHLAQRHHLCVRHAIATVVTIATTS